MSTKFKNSPTLTTSAVIPGVDVFLATEASRFSGRVGLLSNVASLTRDGRTVFTALRDAGLDIAVVFSPEHGYFGLGRAGENMPNAQLSVPSGSVPVVSLHGDIFAPPADLLRPLSAVLVDLQDTGNRWYTYLGTISHLLKTAVQTGTPVVILDRPNPQGGDVVEGPLAEARYFSLIAPAAFPARYGMTIGEGARLLNRTIGANLRVVTMTGWQRAMRYADTGLRWSSPSPNMPHPNTCLLYSGVCLIEATNFSEGRGTALPFTQIGAPFVDAVALADRLTALNLPGVAFTPSWFRPTILKYADQDCQGVRLHVTDGQRIRGFSIGVHLLDTLRRLYPSEFQWTLMKMVDLMGQQGYWIDRLAATDRLRAALEAGQSVADILAWCAQDSAAFREESSGFWLYS